MSYPVMVSAGVWNEWVGKYLCIKEKNSLSWTRVSQRERERESVCVCMSLVSDSVLLSAHEDGCEGIGWFKKKSHSELPPSQSKP